MNNGNQEIKSSTYNASQRGKYRSLSNKINLQIKISQLMKLASNKVDRYNDSFYEIKIGQFSLKLCYGDIDQLKNFFIRKQEEISEQMQKQKQKKSK